MKETNFNLTEQIYLQTQNFISAICSNNVLLVLFLNY